MQKASSKPPRKTKKAPSICWLKKIREKRNNLAIFWSIQPQIKDRPSAIGQTNKIIHSTFIKSPIILEISPEISRNCFIIIFKDSRFKLVGRGDTTPLDVWLVELFIVALIKGLVGSRSLGRQNAPKTVFAENRIFVVFFGGWKSAGSKKDKRKEASGEIRTHDLSLTKRVLCKLSYRGLSIFGCFVMIARF